MSVEILRRRGSTLQHSTFVGGAGELTVDTTKNVAVIHDAALVGGHPVAGTLFANIFSAPQTISLLSGAPTVAFDILTDSVSRFQVRKSGFGVFHRQEADVSPGGIELTKRGNAGSATGALSSGSAISTIDWLGWDGAALGGAGGIRMFTSQAWVPGAHGSKLFFTTVPAGSTSTVNSMELDNTALTVLSRLLLPNTTSATVGGIYFGGNRAFHNFGTNNTFVGVNSGNFTLTGINNTAFGANVGAALTTGFGNSFFGINSGAANTTGYNNTFFGVNSGAANTTANSNSFFGNNSGLSNTTGVNNSFFGRTSGQANTTGFNNSFFGLSSGLSNTSGDSNSFLGAAAGNTNSTGYSNSFFGRNTGYFTTSGFRNSFFGRSAGQANTTGSNNSFFGFNAGDNVTTGSNNLILGFNIDAPVATGSNQMSVGNLIFGTGIDGTGTTISSGLVGVKVITPVTELHVVSTSAADPRGIMSAQHSTDAIGARLHFRKSRGTATVPTTVVTGDVLGRLRFSGYDGANYLQMGSIDVVSVGTIAATRVPTFMCFHTATDATPSVLTERLRIDQAGKIQILTGVGNDAGGFKHARVTTGSVGAGSTALVTITWATAFADTNYTVNASVLEATTSSLSMSVVHVESITAAAVTVRVLNNAVGSLTGTVHVIAVHD